MATLPVQKIDLDEEIEGNIIEISDLFFHKIGEGVPVTSSDFQLDDKFLSFQFLASSERFQIIFVANYRGFLVARTKDVIESAKKLKNKENGLSVEELCVVNVTVGNVNILALSAESSFISVAVGADVHIYEVNALLNKDQKSCFFHSFKSSSVKDIQWSKKFEKSYIVLLENGMLYHGTLTGSPQLVLKDVDAVAWDMRGDFVAVAKRSVVSILSSKFIEKLSISLAMKSWTGKSDLNCMRVDSIRWVRPDCIILGCFEMSGDRKEDSYVLQVLTCKHGEITDVSSRPFVLSFAEVFPAFTDDIVPSDSKSCLFFSYLEQRELAILASRRNTDQHILLMGWSQCDGSNDAAVLDIGRDNLRPWIELKENGDDNMVVGLCIDSTSVYEKVKVCLGVDEPKLLSPFCILICLTLDAKIIMFHVSSSSTKDFPVFSRPLAAASLEVREEHSDLTSQKGEVSNHLSQKPDEKFFESNKSASAYSDNPTLIKFAPDIKSDCESLDESKQGFFHSTHKKVVLPGQPVKNYLNSSIISGHVGISGGTGTQSGTDILGVAVRNSSYTKSNSVEPPNHIEAENLFLKSDSSNELLSNTCRPELNVKITSSSGPKLSKKFGNIREITRELDSLLNAIEGPGGFKDACTVKQNDFLITLEQDMETLFEQCKYWKGTMDDQQYTIQHLFEQTAQTMARKTYIEGIVKQIKDNQYWDLWGTQKLSSELDVKRQHILEIKNNMTSQLNKLEKHFNSLELDKFGVPVRSIKENRRTFYPTRSMQSYHSLHKVMSSQLEAAENHSDCLSKQMTMLGIGNSEKKKKEKKDLFESIGISCESDLFSTPDSKKNADARSLHKLTPSPGSVAYDGSKSRQSNSRHDSESTRRRRDSIDQSWASFEPTTTTLKRVAALKAAAAQGSSEEEQSFMTKTDHPVSAISKQTAVPPPARIKQDAEKKENPSPPLSISPPLNSSTIKSRPPSKQNMPLPQPKPEPKPVPKLEPKPAPNYALLHADPRPPPPVFLRPKSPDNTSASVEVEKTPQTTTSFNSAPLPPPVSRADSPRKEVQPNSKKTDLKVDPPELPPLTIRPFTVPKTETSGDHVFSSEDEMEEEAPETDPVLPSALKTLDGLGLGSAFGSVPKAPNPFGGSFIQTSAPPPALPSGGIFRPASFSIAQPPKNSQPQPPLGFGPLAGAAPAGGGGFGRPATVGVGQQALGSVLGSFGQSRELGGGFSSASQQGFGSAVGSAGGGFAGAGSAGGGFSGIASGGGGFGAFGNQAGGGGFSAFGSTGTVRPASELFTQMRK